MLPMQGILVGSLLKELDPVCCNLKILHATEYIEYFTYHN